MPELDKTETALAKSELTFFSLLSSQHSPFLECGKGRCLDYYMDMNYNFWVKTVFYGLTVWLFILPNSDLKSSNAGWIFTQMWKKYSPLPPLNTFKEICSRRIQLNCLCFYSWVLPVLYLEKQCSWVPSSKQIKRTT